LRIYLDVLSDLIEKYEKANHPLTDLSQAQLLQFFIENRKTTPKEVAQATGLSVSVMSEILSGQMSLTLEHMQKFSEYFRVEIGLFLPKPNPRRAASNE
jgi:antitoxin component HigA of HigAB toxin-antitoxin module